MMCIISTGIKRSFLITALSVWGLILCPLDSASTAQPADAGKEDILTLYKDTVTSYEKIKYKIKTEKQKSKIEKITAQVKDYHTLAKTLEEQGKYKQAAECYKKILNLTNVPEVKSYIRERTKHPEKTVQRSEVLRDLKDMIEKLENEQKTL